METSGSVVGTGLETLALCTSTDLKYKVDRVDRENRRVTVWYGLEKHELNLDHVTMVWGDACTNCGDVWRDVVGECDCGINDVTGLVN